MNPALETLLLAFRPEGGLAVPARALFLGAEPHPDFAEWPHVVGWQPFRPKAEAWEKAGFARVDRPEGGWPVVLALPGKSRDETLAMFAKARDHLAPGGCLVAAMPNTAGAARFEKELAKAAGGVVSISKHKCRAFSVRETGNWDEELFAEWRELGARRRIEENGREFVTEAGVFSAEHADAGSRLLLDHLPVSLRGKAADLGAGWGFLSAGLLERCAGIDKADLYEADARALECARFNLTDFSGRSAFHWHDVTTGLPESGYDVIVMNPPFHTGQSTDIDLGRAFLKTASAALKRGGKLLMVANRQLPYEAVLREWNLHARQVAQDSTYKVIAAERVR